VRDVLRERLEEHRASVRARSDEGKPPPILELMGGPVGLVETVVPVAVFSTAYGITDDLKFALIAAVVPSILVSAWRLARREPLTTALSGLVAVGIGAFIASRTGNASDFFWPSVIKNAAYALLYGVTAVVGWPLIGVMLGYLLGEGTAWRQVPARRRAYLIATWLWFGMFALRVVIQTPLLLADKTVILGAVNIFLGLPLFFLTVWATWMIVRRVPVVRVPDDEQDDEQDDGGQDDAPDPAQDGGTLGGSAPEGRSALPETPATSG
jgi:hypothetical protein